MATLRKYSFISGSDSVSGNSRQVVCAFVHLSPSSVIGCLHDQANIEQLARSSMVISTLIRRPGGL